VGEQSVHLLQAKKGKRCRDMVLNVHAMVSNAVILTFARCCSCRSMCDPVRARNRKENTAEYNVKRLDRYASMFKFQTFNTKR
jgi:hypothetical protein